VTLAAKLAQVSAACRFIEKDGVNAFHKYKFTSAAGVNGHVNPALVAAGLAIVDVDVVILSDVGVGKDRVVTVKVVIVIADTESDARATFRGIGSGQDAGDKAVMKAETAAAKYAWLLGLCIAMGDDHEADEATDRHNAKPAGKQATAQASAQRSAPPQRTDDAAPQDPARAGLAERHDALIQKVDAVASQIDAAKLWHAERATVGQLRDEPRKELWTRLCVRIAKVGKMGDGDAGRKAADAWLRKALAEEAARAAQGNGGASTTAPAG
jgi:hypothetical protein